MIWQEIVKAALIGTGRAKLPPELLEASNKLGIDPEQSPEQQLLFLASAYSQMQKAGKNPIQWTAPLTAPEDTSDSNNSSQEASRILNRILDGEYEELLPEFIQNLIDRQMYLPPESLPDLLQRALGQRNLWEQIKPVIGKRGHWLIRLNPAWKVFSNHHAADIWETGLASERLSYFKYLRHNHPAKATELLSESWEQEGRKDRTKFIQAFEINLRAEDEPFLENCLNVRRKDLRKITSRLLARIPGSALTQRMAQRLDELIALKQRSQKKEKLLIQLPDEWESALARDGIDPNKQWKNGGVKASRFLQMMGLMPPSHWENVFQQTPESIVDIFVRSEWSQLLIQAAIDACCLHRDDAWMTALLKFWIENHHKERWENLQLQPLLEILPDYLFNELLINVLKDSPDHIDAEHPIAHLLRLQLHSWEDRLSMLFIKNLQLWLEKDHNRHWGQWHLRELLKNAAYRCRPELYDYFQQRWPRNAAAWSGWQDEIDDFLRVLRFRKKMKTAL